METTKRDLEKEAEANAHLIAAAPDLLEALNCSAHTLRAIEKHLTGNQLAMVKVQIAACESLIERATK
jgi:hypothetical protein